MKQQKKPTIEKHSKIVMIQAGTPKYSQEAFERRMNIKIFVRTSAIYDIISELENQRFLKIYRLLMQMLIDEESNTKPDSSGAIKLTAFCNNSYNKL